MIQDIEPIIEEPIQLSAEGLREIYTIVRLALKGGANSFIPCGTRNFAA